jgi:hypothetical protein
MAFSVEADLKGLLIGAPSLGLLTFPPVAERGLTSHKGERRKHRRRETTNAVAEVAEVVKHA